MTDSQLPQFKYFVEREAHEVELGKKAASQPWALAARATLSQYLQDFLEYLTANPWTDETVGAFCEVTRPAEDAAGTGSTWPQELMSHVDFSLRNPHEHHHPEADWLLGLALFDAVVGRARAQDGVNVVRLLSPNATRVLAFADAVRGASGAQLQAIVAAMQVFVQDERSSPQKHAFSRDAEHMTAALEQWATVSDVAVIWDSRIWRGLDIFSEQAGVLMPLADAKPAEFLPLLEELQLPPLIEGSLHWRSISANLDKVLSLLDIAPTLFEADGKWNKKVIAAFLLEIAFDHLTQLGAFKKDDGQPFASPDELAGLAKTIVERTLARADGVALLTAWTRHLLWLAGSRASDSGFSAVFNVTLAALAESELSLLKVFPRLSTDAAKSGVLHPQLAYDEANDAFERMTLAAMLMQERVEKGKASRDGAIRLSFLSLMRLARRPFGPLFGDSVPSWRHHPFAELYLGALQPAKLWREDFDSFAFERRARVHYAYTDDDTLSAPSLFLGGVGLALIDTCLDPKQPPQQRAQALAVWQEVFSATREHFTHRSLSHDHWRGIASALFARYPACMKAHEESGGAAELPHKWLPLLGTDEVLFATAVANLVANGMQLEAIGETPAYATEARRRVLDYLGWEGSAGSRTLAPGVVKYLQTHVVRASASGG
jgi:hypothetical protein